MDGDLPTLTIIIPAYNEGAMVEHSLYSVARSDYPREKLEIICIDDGSTDDTWEYIDRARQRYPGLIKTIRFPDNRGKKEGLYAGFTQGRGEILVTVDSDSVIEPSALRHLVAPLQQDAGLGAVAGNVRVYNRHASLMGKMQWVRYVNLDFLRAAQSVYKTVTCTPGSLAAYRRTALVPHLQAWRHQTFLGSPCVHSEDRALTNFVLRHGWYTYYQRTAKVYTIVPETYTGVVNMYLRWERGNVRESFVQLSYLFTRYRSKHRLVPIVEFFLTQLELPMLILAFGFFRYLGAPLSPHLFQNHGLPGPHVPVRPHLLPLAGAGPGIRLRHHLQLLRLFPLPMDLPVRLLDGPGPALADEIAKREILTRKILPVSPG